MNQPSLDSLKTKSTLSVKGKNYSYYSLKIAEQAGVGAVSTLPYSLKIVLENLIRHEDGTRVTLGHIKSICQASSTPQEIAFSPARVLMQDFTGVPAIVDLAAMRDAMTALGKNPDKVNPFIPVDLVIDHSVMVDNFGTKDAFEKNVELEYHRNLERYAFLRWGQKAFSNFRVVPPGTGICHQVNLEYLAQVVWTNSDDDKNGPMAYPDTLVGTDSHTTMVNGLSVLGWGVGGIEAEAAMLSQPLSMLIPAVVGFKLIGQLKEGVTATDLVLTITNILRTKGVVGKFVEFYGTGLDTLSLADRATIANMAPEYGATCGFFPIDQETLSYLSLTGRAEAQIALVEAYAKAQGLWRDASTPDPLYADTVQLDLATIDPTIAGPKRPQDKVLLKEVKNLCDSTFRRENKTITEHLVENCPYTLAHGHVVIAAITSCTNTSNPSVLMAAGLLARKALQFGLTTKPWVKTSLAPGSQVVTDYLAHSGLDKDLDALGFNLVGYGCTTCIGNSGPLNPSITKTIEQHDLTVAGVLSGNRNFEGRINPHVKDNYLASPPLVVAYALVGSMLIDFEKEPLGISNTGEPVFLKDVWPSNQEIQETISRHINPRLFQHRYSDVFKGDSFWQNIKTAEGKTYTWDSTSTYVKNPPYFTEKQKSAVDVKNIHQARLLAVLGDSVTTDHISPAGSIKKEGPAGQYLQDNNVIPLDFNSYGARRGNHEVMMRGTFANIRLQNELVPEKQGGITKVWPTGQTVSIYEAAMDYKQNAVPLVVMAGKEYGTGSSRDWAAKGTKLLGVKAVIAESFERIHRSNLVGMGVLPLQFMGDATRRTLNLSGHELISIKGLEAGIRPGMTVTCLIESDQKHQEITLLCRIDTQEEVDYFSQGGILPYVLHSLAKKP